MTGAVMAGTVLLAQSSDFFSLLAFLDERLPESCDVNNFIAYKITFLTSFSLYRLIAWYWQLCKPEIPRTKFSFHLQAVAMMLKSSRPLWPSKTRGAKRPIPTHR